MIEWITPFFISAAVEHDDQDNFNKYLVKNDLFKYIERYLETNKSPKNIFIYGKRGSGKTALLYWIKQFLEKKNVLNVYVNPNYYFSYSQISSDLFFLLVFSESLVHKLKDSCDNNSFNSKEYLEEITLINNEIEKSSFTNSYNIDELQDRIINNFTSIINFISGITNKLVILVDEFDKYPSVNKSGFKNIIQSKNQTTYLKLKNFNFSFVVAAPHQISDSVIGFFSSLTLKGFDIYNIQWDIGYISEMIRKRIEFSLKKTLLELLTNESIYQLCDIYNSNPRLILESLHNALYEYSAKFESFDINIFQSMLKDTAKNISVNTEYENSANFTENIKKYWDNINYTKDNSARGHVFEDFITFLFNSINDFEIIDKNIRTSAEEIDIIIKNHNTQLSVLGTPIIIECKYWSKPVGSKEVNWFISKVSKRSLSVGILIAFEGVSGNEFKDAKLEIIRALENNIKIIVLDKNVLKVIYQPEDLMRLIEEKYYQIYKL